MENYYSEDEYDIDNESPFTIEDNIDLFISNYLDNIIDIYVDFEERFAYTPKFLEYARENSTVLVSFIIDYLFKNTTFNVNDSKKIKFQMKYQNELNESYNTIYNFTKTTGNIIPEKEWINFCYCMSNV